MANFTISRRGLLKTSAVTGAGLAAPTIWSRPAYAYTNEPSGSTVTLGFNVPSPAPTPTRARTSCSPTSWPWSTSTARATAA